MTISLHVKIIKDLGLIQGLLNIACMLIYSFHGALGLNG